MVRTTILALSKILTRLLYKSYPHRTHATQPSITKFPILNPCLELVRSIWVISVFVWVHLLGQPPVGLFDLIRRRTLIYAQDAVEITPKNQQQNKGNNGLKKKQARSLSIGAKMVICRNSNLSVCRSVGLLVCWSVGLLVCWSVGLLVCLSKKNSELFKCPNFR